jgi:hypothetical protein
MKFKAVFLLAAALCLGSCAKDLPGGANGNYTQLTWSFTTAQQINPNYIYVVAIRVLTPPVGTYNTELSDPSQGPSPVVATGSQNGVVGGLPTHIVLYTPNSSPTSYTVYRFPLSTEVPLPTGDPSPINLAWPGQPVGDVYPGDTDPQQNGNGNQFSFTIDTSYLAQHVPGGNAQSIQVIQFNVFAMNVALLSTANIQQRVMDAIGNSSSASNQTFNNPITTNITTSAIISDQTSTVQEMAGDTYPAGSNLPSVDLTSWSLTVQTPQ